MVISKFSLACANFNRWTIIPPFWAKNQMPSSSMNLKDCDPKVIFAHIQDEKPKKGASKAWLFFKKVTLPLTQPNRFQSFSGNKIKQLDMLAASWWLQSHCFSKKCSLKLDQLKRYRCRKIRQIVSKLFTYWRNWTFKFPIQNGRCFVTTLEKFQFKFPYNKWYDKYVTTIGVNSNWEFPSLFFNPPRGFNLIQTSHTFVGPEGCPKGSSASWWQKNTTALTNSSMI